MAEITGKTTTKKAVTKATAASAKPVEKKALAAKKPVAAKAAEKKTATAKVAASKPAVPKTAEKKPAAKRAAKIMNVTDEQRYRMVAEAAYYRAESNQFKSDPVRDWIEAEGDIAALLSGRK